MPAVDYLYTPQYGVENYLDINGVGGAEETNDNLLITLYELNDVGPPIDATLLVPNYVNINIPSNNQLAFQKGMKSRIAASFFLDTSQSTKFQDLLAVLKPPPEYAQQLVKSVVFNGGDVDDLTNYDILRPLQGNYSWKVSIYDSQGGQNIVIPAPLVNAISYSTYVALGGGGDATPMAFLKTNGADGVTPEFFTRDAAGIQEAIATVDAGGEFYIAMPISTQGFDNQGAYVVIEWPYSTGRG